MATATSASPASIPAMAGSPSAFPSSSTARRKSPASASTVRKASAAIFAMQPIPTPPDGQRVNGMAVHEDIGGRSAEGQAVPVQAVDLRKEFEAVDIGSEL